MSKKLGLLLASMLLIVTSFLVSVSPAAADTVKVKMGTDTGALGFEPSVVTIKVGDSVQWINNKLAPHNVVFDSTKVDEAVATKINHKALLFSPGESFETTFTEAGEYPYYCEPHRGAGMVGKVIVQ